MLVPLGVGPEGGTLGRIAPGILWVGALLACLLSLDRIFALDFEDGSLDLLATAPIPLEAVVAVKALAHWLVTGLPLTVLAPGLAVLLNLPPAGLWLAGAQPLAWHAGAVGDRGLRRGADGRAAARRAASVSLLVLPLYVPTLIFGAEVVRRGAEGMELATPLALLGGDQPWRVGAAALRGGGGAPRQFALELVARW